MSSAPQITTTAPSKQFSIDVESNAFKMLSEKVYKFEKPVFEQGNFRFIELIEIDLE